MTKLSLHTILLGVAPILIQIPYAMLISGFDYPDILMAEPAKILVRFQEAGPGLPWIWFGFAMAILPLMIAIASLPSRFAQSALLRAGTHFGIASALLQMTGLLRWVFLVPVLAAQYEVADEARRAAIEIAFLSQHRLFGVLMGEFLGQLTLGVWTFTLAGTLGGRGQKLLGYGAGALFVVGSMSNLLPILEPLPTIAFLVWSVWCVLAALLMIRDDANRRASGQSIS